MESNQFTQQGEQRRAIRVSGKLFNDADGLIWPTGGRFAALSGRRYASLKHVAFICIHAPCFISLFERVFFAKPVSTFARHALVVGRTTAGSMPRQKARQTGQMTPYWLKLL